MGPSGPPPGGALSGAAPSRRRRGSGRWERFTAGDFKDRFGLSRKGSIPLLERMGSTGVSRRLGDERMVVRG